MGSRTAVVAMTAAWAVAGLVGCGADRSARPDAALMDTAGLTKDQVTERGEQMVARGRTMVSRASLMSDSATMNGMSRDDVHARGEQLMHDGDALVARGNGM